VSVSSWLLSRNCVTLIPVTRTFREARKGESRVCPGKVLKSAEPLPSSPELARKGLAPKLRPENQPGCRAIELGRRSSMLPLSMIIRRIRPSSK
jgi:hypothetical protein